MGIGDNWAYYDKMKTGSICGKRVLELTSRFCTEFLVCDDELVLQSLHDDMDQELSVADDDGSHLSPCTEELHSSCHVGMGHGASWGDQT